jgi:hypothetical protein
MRALLSKVMTGSMVAGAALLVAACGGGSDEAANNTATDVGTEALDTTNDVTAIDAGTGADTNMAGDTGAMDANAMDNTAADTSTNMTNGM